MLVQDGTALNVDLSKIQVYVKFYNNYIVFELMLSLVKIMSGKIQSGSQYVVNSQSKIYFV